MSSETDRLGERVSRIEGTLDQMNERLGTIEGRLNNHDERFDRLDTKIEGVDGRIDEAKRDIRRWLVFVVLAITAAFTVISVVIQVLL